MKTKYALLVLAVLSLIPLRSMLWMDDWMTHDVQGYAVRLAALATAMDEGQWLGRWTSVLDRGYGYPLFHYYPPGFYLLGTLLYQSGLALMPSIKVALALVQVTGVLGMFGLCRIFYSHRASYLCALAWAFLPYQQVNVFVRGAFAEFAALHFLVVSLCFCLRFARDQKMRDALLASFFVMLMIVSHAVTALIGMPLLVALTMAFKFSQKRANVVRMTFLGVGPIALGLLLAAFYWLPALADVGFVRTEEMAGGDLHFSNHFLYWPQWLNVTYWGFGPSVPGRDDGMPLHVGLVPLLFLGLGWWACFKRKKAIVWPLVAGTIGAAVLLFMTLNASHFIWENLPLVRYVQFPWRLLGEVGILMVLAGGAGVEFLVDKIGKRRWAVPAATVLIVLSPPWHWQPSSELPLILPDRPTAENLRQKTWALTSDDEYLPRDVQEKFPSEYPPQQCVMARGKSEMRRVDEGFEFDVTEAATIVYGEYWFPGLKVIAGGERIAARPSKIYGLIEFDLKSGKYLVQFIRGRTPMQKVGDGLAMGGFMIFLALGFLGRRFGRVNEAQKNIQPMQG